MIALTRLDGTRVLVNAEQIAWVEAKPDTVISMMNGDKMIVVEGLETVVQRVIAYKRSFVAPGFRSLHGAGPAADTPEVGDVS